MLFETFTKLRALLHEYVFLSTKGIFPSYLTFSYILILQVAKQWYDFDRQTFTFVKKIKREERAPKVYLPYWFWWEWIAVLDWIQC